MVQLVGFLQKINMPLSLDITSYPIKKWDLKWQTQLQRNDCGVFLMIHMKKYKGKHFKSDLDKPKRRDYYRAAICADIVTSSINMMKQELLQKVISYRPQRHELMQKKKSGTGRKEGTKKRS